MKPIFIQFVNRFTEYSIDGNVGSSNLHFRYSYYLKYYSHHHLFFIIVCSLLLLLSLSRSLSVIFISYYLISFSKYSSKQVRIEIQRTKELLRNSANRAPLVSIPVSWIGENSNNNESEVMKYQTCGNYSGPDLPYFPVESKSETIDLKS